MDTSYEDKMYRQIEKSLSNNINDRLFVPIEMINKPKYTGYDNRQIVDSVSYEENKAEKEPLSLNYDNKSYNNSNKSHDNKSYNNSSKSHDNNYNKPYNISSKSHDNNNNKTYNNGNKTYNNGSKTYKNNDKPYNNNISHNNNKSYNNSLSGYDDRGFSYDNKSTYDDSQSSYDNNVSSNMVIDNEAGPRMSRAEYILQAREACLQQMNASEITGKTSDFYVGDEGTIYFPHDKKRKGKIDKLFNDGNEEEVPPEELASFKSLIIRTVCAAVVFISIFIIDKIKMDWGVFSYETIRQYVTGNNQLKLLEDIIVAFLK